MKNYKRKVHMKKSLLAFIFLVGAGLITQPINRPSVGAVCRFGVKATVAGVFLYKALPFAKNRIQDVISIRSGEDVQNLFGAYARCTGRFFKSAGSDVWGFVKGSWNWNNSEEKWNTLCRPMTEIVKGLDAQYSSETALEKVANNTDAKSTDEDASAVGDVD